MEKSQHREIILKKRKSLTKEFISFASSRILSNFKTNFFYSGKKIAIYFPINNEADSMLFLNLRNAEFSLPAINDNQISFFPWEREQPLEYKGALLIPEPQAQKTPIIPDIIITPLVGFTKKCERIGYGKGYYDRFFQMHPDPVKIGIAFEIQKINDSSLQFTHYDIKLDYIVTENNIYENL